MGAKMSTRLGTQEERSPLRVLILWPSTVAQAPAHSEFDSRRRVLASIRRGRRIGEEGVATVRDEAHATKSHLLKGRRSGFHAEEGDGGGGAQRAARANLHVDHLNSGRVPIMQDRARNVDPALGIEPSIANFDSHELHVGVIMNVREALSAESRPGRQSNRMTWVSLPSARVWDPRSLPLAIPRCSPRS